MKLSTLPVLCLWVLACQDPTPPSIASPKATVVHAEPPTNVAAEPFDGCDYHPMPMLIIMPSRVLLDGNVVDLASLGEALRNRQDLYRAVGNERNEIALQVLPGVSEKRVAPFLATARAAGFVNVTRLPSTKQQHPKH